MGKNKKKETRQWLPTFSGLIDRLSIHQLKEVFLPENKKKYSEEMECMCNDLDSIIKEKDIKLTSDFIRSIIVVSQLNLHIWHNESEARKGGEQDLRLLKLTHGLNGLRNRTCNYIAFLIGNSERQDWKTDCLASEFKDWEISLLDTNKDK
jgi:hypothetical protein